MKTRTLDALPPGVRLGVSPLSWANDVLEDLGADIPLETCLNDAAEVGYRASNSAGNSRAMRRRSRRCWTIMALRWPPAGIPGLLAEKTVDDEMKPRPTTRSF